MEAMGSAKRHIAAHLVSLQIGFRESRVPSIESCCIGSFLSRLTLGGVMASRYSAAECFCQARNHGVHEQ